MRSGDKTGRRTRAQKNTFCSGCRCVRPEKSGTGGGAVGLAGKHAEGWREAHGYPRRFGDAAALGGKRDGQRCGGVGTQAGRVRGPHSGLGFAEVPPAPVDPSRSNRRPATSAAGARKRDGSAGRTAASASPRCLRHPWTRPVQTGPQHVPQQPRRYRRGPLTAPTDPRPRSPPTRLGSKTAPPRSAAAGPSATRSCPRSPSSGRCGLPQAGPARGGPRA